MCKLFVVVVAFKTIPEFRKFLVRLRFGFNFMDCGVGGGKMAALALKFCETLSVYILLFKSASGSASSAASMDRCTCVDLSIFLHRLDERFGKLKFICTSGAMSSLYVPANVTVHPLLFFFNLCAQSLTEKFVLFFITKHISD